MSIEKFNSRKNDVERLTVKPIFRDHKKQKKEYNADYRQRSFNDQVKKGLQRKLLKMPKEMNDFLKAKLNQDKEELAKQGIKSIQDMILFAIEMVWYEED